MTDRGDWPPRPEGAPHVELIDIGVNLAGDAFDADRDAVIDRALAAGVVHQLVTASDVAEARAVQSLVAVHPDRLSGTAGVHPHHAGQVEGEWLRELEALLAAPGIRAVGETGLDFNRDYSPRPAQEAVFEAQLDLAARTGTPLFLHERDTDGRFFELLASWVGRVRGVLHCFTGSARDLHRALDAGLHIGITGWICDERRGTELQSLVRDIPADRLLLETDAPYLLPRTIRPRPRTRRNEPALLPWVLMDVARCRDESPVTLAGTTTRNSATLFDLTRADVDRASPPIDHRRRGPGREP